MTEPFDSRLSELAAEVARDHEHGPALDLRSVKTRARRNRRVRDVVVGSTAVGVLAAGLLGGAALVDRTDPLPPAESTTRSPERSPERSPGPDASPEAALPAVVDGWQVAQVDPAVFGDTVITGAVSLDGRAVVIGCRRDGAVGFPAWVAQAPTDWAPAALDGGSGPQACLDDVVSTSHGLFAVGTGLLYHSDDGSRWTEVSLVEDPEAAGAWVTAVFAVGDRVTVLVHRAAEAETRVAALYTTTDGREWTTAPEELARVFDDASTTDVLATDTGLVAVGASPSGELVPTAAAWTSADGLHWELVTPGDDGFADCQMGAAAATADGFLAVGTCPSQTLTLAVWSSPDGTRWSRVQTAETDDGDPSLGYVVASDLTVLGEDRYAVGVDSAARPTTWRSVGGGPWDRVATTEQEAFPRHVVDVGGTAVGFWTGTVDAAEHDPVRVLAGD